MNAGHSDPKWVIVRIDGRIAAISTDYRLLAEISARLAKDSHAEPIYDRVCADTVSMDDVMKLRDEVKWEDLMLFGTDFQKMVWRNLWNLTHGSNISADSDDRFENKRPELLSYSDFAEICGCRAGVRAVAHAVGLNPISVIIPCHLIIPKEAVDRIQEIKKKAESTIFKGEDLCLGRILEDPSIDFGEYALGRELKRQLITRDLL